MNAGTLRLVVAVVGAAVLTTACGGETQESAQPPVRKPTAADLAKLTDDPAAFVDRLLGVIEDEIVPLTRQGVSEGNKLFGAAVLRKSDLSTVVAVTNRETANPLNHGEVQAINAFYALPRDQRPPANECIFLATHEPCPLCLSSISWGGFDNFFYLFSYEDSKDAFGIPHDLQMLEEVFRCPDGSYSEKNHYWSSWRIGDVVSLLEPDARASAGERMTALRTTYDELSATYQRSKGGDADIPLK